MTLSDDMSNSELFVHFEQKNSGQIIHIKHPNCTASISIYGGHVLHWQPLGQESVFWLSDSAQFEQGIAIRGGIPICWPWFGSKDGTTSHGFARQNNWQLESINSEQRGVTVTLSLNGKDLDQQWPYAFELKQQLFFGQHFSQRLVMTNVDNLAWEYTGALHTYFRVGKPEQVVVPQLSDFDFDDKITQQSYCEPEQLLHCRGPLDRIYYTNEVTTLIDQQLRRMITVESDSCHQRVIWNPGSEIAKSMVDVHSNGEHEFVCLEVANTDSQVVEPGMSVEISQIITVSN